MIGDAMAFLDLAFLSRRKFAEHLSKMPSRLPLQCLPRHFGMNATWELYSHFVWLGLSYSSFVKLPFACGGALSDLKTDTAGRMMVPTKAGSQRKVRSSMRQLQTVGRNRDLLRKNARTAPPITLIPAS
jgi:hypothetical protein